MSDYTVVKLVNQRLRQALYEGLSEPLTESWPFFQNIDSIHIGSPKETADLANAQTKRLSVFLYQITEDPFMKNRPPLRTNDRAIRQVPPMALRFHYLITPFMPDADGTAIVIGKVLETLYERSSLDVVDPVTLETEEVRIIFETLSLAELAEVWEALKEPYKISLAYQLRVPRLESRRRLTAVPVGEAASEYGGLPDPVAVS